jgi:hypothetical protein
MPQVLENVPVSSQLGGEFSQLYLLFFINLVIFWEMRELPDKGNTIRARVIKSCKPHSEAESLKF